MHFDKPLRVYQSDAYDRIIAAFNDGKKRVLLRLATGAGKTEIFCRIIQNYASQGLKILVVTTGRKIIEQATNRLTQMGIPHGVIMNGYPHSNSRVVVCSIDTLRARMMQPYADIVIVDEAHLAGSKKYQQFLNHYKDSFILSVTATPYNSSTPIKHLAEHVIKPVSVDQLIEQKFLSSIKYFCPVQLNLEQTKLSMGDYDEQSLVRTMKNSRIVGDLVHHWIAYGEKRPTLCFAVNVEHSKLIVSRFVEAGISAVHLDGSSSDELRNRMIEDLKAGKIKVLSNVNIFSTGVDLPFVSCLILARPTLSMNLYIQQVGRGMRIDNGKLNCIVLDHAENIFRHGRVEKEHAINGEKLFKCADCGSIYTDSKDLCPACRAKDSISEVDFILERPRQINEVDGELVELSADLDTLTKGKITPEIWAKLIMNTSPSRAKSYLKLKSR